MNAGVAKPRQDLLLEMRLMGVQAVPVVGVHKVLVVPRGFLLPLLRLLRSQIFQVFKVGLQQLVDCRLSVLILLVLVMFMQSTLLDFVGHVQQQA